MKITRIKEWGAFVLLTFFLYDLIWILIDFQSYSAYRKSDEWLLLKDFLFCVIFATSGITIGNHTIRKVSSNRWGANTSILVGIFTLLSNILLAIILEYVHSNYFIESMAAEDVWENIYWSCLISTSCSLILLNKYYYGLIVSRQKEVIELKKRELKQQLDPHFIFNSLSILAGLTRVDAKAAEEYTVRLAKNYRYIINNVDQELVTIHEAIKQVQNYAYLLQVRFPKHIQFDVSGIAARTNECLLSLSLQLLVENAVKHNFPNEDHTLCISIRREGDDIVVSNNLKQGGNRTNTPSCGIGLSNLRQRYLLISDKLPVISMKNGFFEVRLPIIKKL